MKFQNWKSRKAYFNEVCMSDKYQKKIRKEIASNYKKMYSQLLDVIELKVQSQSFIQRLKVAMKYLFCKKFDLHK